MSYTILTRAAFGAFAVLLAATSTFATAQAQPAAPTAQKQPSEPQPPKLSICEIVARVEAQGYSEIEEIEREGSSYEVSAKDASGKEVELTVNSKTGSIEEVESDED